MKRFGTLFLFVALTASLTTTGCTRGAPDANDDDENHGPPATTADNGWPISNLPDDYSGTGYSIGDYVPIFEDQHDQHGNEDLSLGQFYGSMMLISFGAVWCAPCNLAAETSQELINAINDRLDGQATAWEIELLLDDASFGAASDGGWAELVDAENWATDYAIEYPVLHSRPAWMEGQAWPVNAFPTLWFVDPSFEIRAIIEGHPGDATILRTMLGGFDEFMAENPEWTSPFAG